jgi:hypothetical protein
VNPQGLVTGAGIGAILSLPTLDPRFSNATLTAPHGTVDAGAAGIRVAGNLNIVAARVTNAYNIQVQGNVSGLAATAAPPANAGALTAASNAAGSAAKVNGPAQTSSGASDTPSLIIVEVLGYGGPSGESPSSGAAAGAPSGGNAAGEKEAEPASGRSEEKKLKRRTQ